MKKFFIALPSLCLFFITYTASAFEGGEGSVIDNFQVNLKVELKNSDGNWSTLYSGSEYLETVGTGAGTIAGSLQGTKPPVGTYTHLRSTANGMKVKATIVVGGVSYYTTTQSSADSDVWVMSTNSADYGFVTITTVYPSETELPTPLVVTADQDVNIIWAVQAKAGTVLYETDSTIDTGGEGIAAAINWAGREDIFKTILPSIPDRIVQIPYSVTQDDSTKLLNTISMFIDSEGNLLGGDCHRPSNKAINCSFLKAGSLSNVTSGGAAASFSVTHWDGDASSSTDGVDDYYTITGSYDCVNSTFSSLAITDNGTVSYDYTVSTSTLATTGTATCITVP